MEKIILFDFDGVIADSFDSAFEVNKLMCPHVTEDDYRRAFEGNINDWDMPVHTDECKRDIDFFGEYVPKMKNVKIFDGMSEVIKSLSHSYKLIIISSTITSPIKEFMERHRVAQYFTEIMGNDVHASKVEKIKMVFSKYGVDAKKCLFVTDTLGDMKEAASAGVVTIGVAWGFQNKETLLKGNPLLIAQKPEELLSAISGHFHGQSY